MKMPNVSVGRPQAVESHPNFDTQWVGGPGSIEIIGHQFQQLPTA